MRNRKENNLLEGNLYRNIIRLGFPLALASVLHTFYNLADTFWLGRLGRQTLSAPVISFNIIFFIISLAIGFSIAGTSMVSQFTGAGDTHRANKSAGNLMMFLLVLSLFFVGVGLIFDRELLVLLKTPDDTFSLTQEYLRIIILGMPLAFPFFVYQSVLSGYGDTVSPLKIEVVSAVINLILDPILIFGWLGMPAMGVKGAALTTIITRGLASVIGVYHLFSGKKGIRLKLNQLIPDPKILKTMIKIGIPSAIGMAGASLGFMVLIGIVNQFGTSVISAYGIANRVVHLFMMPAIGMSSAVTAIVGQNLGAGNMERAKNTVKKGVFLILMITVPAMILVSFWGKHVTYLFIPNDPLVHQIGQTMFYFVCPAVIFFALSAVISGAFKGSGFTFPVMVMDLSRIWIFRIPLVYVISMVVLNGPMNINASVGIWMGILFSNFIAFLIIYIWYLKGKWLRIQVVKGDLPE